MTFVYPVKSNDAHPAPLSPDYKSSVKRAPQKPLIPMRHTLSELTGPVYGHETVRSGDADLTTQKLLRQTDLPLDWAEQKCILGFI